MARLEAESAMDRGRAYLLLGLSTGASQDEVKASYRKLAKKWHPDSNSGDKRAADKFKEVGAAYDHLKSLPEVATPKPPSRGSDTEIEVALPLEAFLPGGRGRLPDRRRCRRCEGEGRVELDVPVDCPACGGTGFGRHVSGFIRVRVPCEGCDSGGRLWFTTCPDCGGSGEGAGEGPDDFEVPPGLEEGEIVRIEGLGGPGLGGGHRGDLFVRVRSAPHAIFRRSGSDLAATVRVSFADLCLGGEVAVPQLGGGPPVRLAIPRGTKASSTLQMKGRGLAAKDGTRGRLLVRLVPDVPANPSPEQESLMARWRQTERH
jgi:molecular chaperone DnaJ